MEKPKGKVEWLVWSAMGFTILAIGVAFLLEAHPSGPKLPVLFEKLPDFALTNQAGQIVVNSSLQENAPGERQSDADLFLHSEKFVLVDKKGRVRAYYDGTDTDSIPKITSAAKSLLREK